MKRELTDTHCHLDDRRYADDLDCVINRDREMGFILVPGCDYQSSLRALEIAAGYPNVYAAVGQHPTEIESWSGEDRERIRELAQKDKVLAIGEIGLDYHYEDNPDPELQKKVFTDQIRLAAELGLPFIVHARDALEDTMAIVEREAKTPYVFHAYSGDLESARRITDENYISVGGVLTFKNAGELPEIIEKIPLERILIETDGPYLTPVPHRGKRNEPAYTRLVAEKLAQIKGLPVEEVLRVTAENARRFFSVEF